MTLFFEPRTIPGTTKSILCTSLVMIFIVLCMSKAILIHASSNLKFKDGILQHYMRRKGDFIPSLTSKGLNIL